LFCDWPKAGYLSDFIRGDIGLFQVTFRAGCGGMKFLIG